MHFSAADYEIGSLLQAYIRSEIEFFWHEFSINTWHVHKSGVCCVAFNFH